ncbi:MAG: CBS domain-containing protein [Caldimonas sp.]
MSQPISALMERRVWTVDMDDSVAEVERLFGDRGLAWAPVLESRRTIVGVVSAADLLQFHAQGRDPTATRAWQLCTYKPVTVGPETPLGEVARQMIERRIHHVVVIEGDKVVGVVSSLDFVRTFVDTGDASAMPVVRDRAAPNMN